MHNVTLGLKSLFNSQVLKNLDWDYFLENNSYLVNDSLIQMICKSEWINKIQEISPFTFEHKKFNNNTFELLFDSINVQSYKVKYLFERAISSNYISNIL